MSVCCPASGCGFSGTLDQVEGHLGGVADSLHEGVVVPDLTKSLHGEASEGLSYGLLAGVVVGAIALWMLYQVTATSPEGAVKPVEQQGVTGSA